MGRGRRPECERAEPGGTSPARRGRRSAPPGDARPCAAAAWTLGPERTRTGEWPARGRRGDGATGRGSAGRSRESGTSPGEVRARCGDGCGRAWEGRQSHTRGAVCPIQGLSHQGTQLQPSEPQFPFLGNPCHLQRVETLESETASAPLPHAPRSSAPDQRSEPNLGAGGLAGGSSCSPRAGMLGGAPRAAPPAVLFGARPGNAFGGPGTGGGGELT